MDRRRFSFPLTLFVAVSLVSALLIASCGSSDGNAGPDPIEAQQITEAMLTDARGGGIVEACEYLSADGLLRYEASEDALNELLEEPARDDDCEGTLESSILSRFTYKVSDLTVSPDGRQVAVRVHNDLQSSNIPFLLEPEEGEWKISMIGVQDDRATSETLELVEEGGFDPGDRPDLYMP